jgi:imidazolonepropionase-like amidohydrolase
MLLSLLLSPALAGDVLALKPARAYDPATGRTWEAPVVVVRGGRIAEIGPEVRPPARAEVIELPGATLLPGLIDAHTHLCSSAELRSAAIAQVHDELARFEVTTSTAARALDGAVNAAAMLEAGFTTVRDLGNAGLYADTALREAVEAGDLPGPQIVNAGKIIAPFGGQLHGIPEHPEVGGADFIEADGPADIARAVRQNLHYGARWIKLVVDDQPYTYTREEIAAAVEEAGRAGVKVAAHVNTDASARAAIEAGVASLEHAFSVSPETLALAAERGVAVVATPFSLATLAEYDEDRGVRQAIFDAGAGSLRRAAASKAPLVFGSDVYVTIEGLTRGQAALEGLDAWSQAGVPVDRTLKALTSEAAALLELDDRGRLEPGLRADLVVVQGDPREDLDALKQAVMVVQAGEVVLSP